MSPDSQYSEAQSSSRLNTPSDTKDPKTSKRRPVVLIVVAAVLLVGTGVGAWLLVSTTGEEDKPKTIEELYEEIDPEEGDNRLRPVSAEKIRQAAEEAAAEEEERFAEMDAPATGTLIFRASADGPASVGFGVENVDTEPLDGEKEYTRDVTRVGDLLWFGTVFPEDGSNTTAKCEIYYNDQLIESTQSEAGNPSACLVSPEKLDEEGIDYRG